MNFTDTDNAESTKGAVHGALGTLAILCAVYNGSAYLKRQERHLLINLIVYTGLVLYEIRTVTHHCGSHID